jgi:hypothetical protein
VAVRHAGEWILVEEWGMELDTGDYYRLLYCLDKSKVTLADSLTWSIALENDSSKDTGWGFESRWKLGPEGQFTTTSKQFVDLREKPIAEPDLESDRKQQLGQEGVGAFTWVDLGLPDALIK